MCQKLWKLIESRQSYSKESHVQFFWPTLYIATVSGATAAAAADADSGANEVVTDSRSLMAPISLRVIATAAAAVSCHLSDGILPCARPWNDGMAHCRQKLEPIVRTCWWCSCSLVPRFNFSTPAFSFYTPPLKTAIFSAFGHSIFWDMTTVIVW